MATMSDSSIRLKPVIDEPSKPMPSSSAPGSSSRPTANDLSCPKMSVNQNRMNSTLSLLDLREHVARAGPVFSQVRLPSSRDLLVFVCLQHVLALLAGADANRLLDRQDEELPVTDRAGPRVPQDHLLDQPDVLRLDDALELQLRP